MVVAPHPDDETLGCGATIARKVEQGRQVTVLMVTDGRGSHRSSALPPPELARVRAKEAAEAAHRLGLPATALRWAGLPDGAVADHEDALVEVVRSLVDEVRPDEVYVTSAEEPHPDHATAARAVRRATMGSRVVVWEYPIWLWGAWPVRAEDRFRSTAAAAWLCLLRRAAAVRADEHLARKQDALRAYVSQLDGPPGVPAGTPWPVLPPQVLAAAAEPVEVFLPVPEVARTKR